MLRLPTVVLIVASATTILFSSTQCRAASFNLFSFDPELSAFIQNYRQTPDPKAAVDRYFTIELDAFLDQAQRAEQPHSRAALMAFYIHIVHDNPELCVPFANRLVSEATGERAAFGAEVLAYGAGEHRNEALSIVVKGFKLPPEAMDTYTALEPFPYPKMDATDWQTLDILWASYFASGNDLYIRKIAAPLVYFQPRGPDFDAKLRALSAQDPQPGTPEHSELMGMLTAQASHFGLSEIALINPDVLRTIKTIASENRGKVSTVAGEIVKQTQNRIESEKSAQ